MTTTTIELKPWITPNFATMEMPPALKQDGIRELPSIPIADLSADTLRSLAHQWLVALYAKAGKPLPAEWNLSP